MHQSGKPLAEEVSREVGRLRERLGVRRLARQHEEEPAGAGPAGAAPGEKHPVSTPPPAGFSLLWPADDPENTFSLPRSSEDDLGLETTLAGLAFKLQKEQIAKTRAVLLRLCRDPQAIIYRQEILADLLRHRGLAAGLEALLPLIDQLGFYSKPGRDMVELYQVTWWLGELESYVECIQAATRAFRQVDGELHAEGLRRLRAYVEGVEGDDTFRHLVRELPDLLAQMRGVLSVTIGVNLDTELRPVEATLISVNDERFVEPPLLRLLFGSTGEYEGLMPLHSANSGAGGRPDTNPLMVPLFRDLSRVLEQVSKPVGQALQAYINLNQGFLLKLGQELAFYVGAANLVARVRASGLPMCRPELAPEEARVCDVEEGYNLSLALQRLSGHEGRDLSGEVVTNHIRLDEEGRVAILTGPNRGGKTTLAQAVGLIQVLAQAGLYVPGSRARISPVDGVYTHFPVEEELARGTGRFGDEAQRLRNVLSQATRHSLLLLNESLSSTHPGESLYLARDIVRVCRRLGTRLIFVTHLHELAAQAEALNDETPGDSRIVSLVSSMIDGEAMGQEDGQAALERSYRVRRAPPMGRSYALELARSYGISYEQLVEMLEERGAL